MMEKSLEAFYEFHKDKNITDLLDRLSLSLIEFDDRAVDAECFAETLLTQDFKELNPTLSEAEIEELVGQKIGNHMDKLKTAEEEWGSIKHSVEFLELEDQQILIEFLLLNIVYSGPSIDLDTLAGRKSYLIVYNAEFALINIFDETHVENWVKQQGGGLTQGLIHIIESNSYELDNVINYIIWLFGVRGSPDAVDTLIDCISNPRQGEFAYEDVILPALEALVKIGIPAIEPLEILLSKSNWEFLHKELKEALETITNN